MVKAKLKYNTFFDFCSGIGAGRLGLEQIGMVCVGHSEIDPQAERTYRRLFGDGSDNHGDLMKIDPTDLPDFDVMVAGFPCQTFSIVGKRGGFEDERGNIIFGLIKILRAKQTPAFLLENVKGLVNHDKGQTLSIILRELRRSGYRVYTKVLNSFYFGVPQLRERIYLVGFLDDDFGRKDFFFPEEKESMTSNLFPFLDPCNTHYLPTDDPTFQKYLSNKYNLGRISLDALLNEEGTVLDTRQSDLRFYPQYFPTLRTGRHGLLYVRNGRLVRLNGLEALALQGFPPELIKRVANDPNRVSNGALLSQAGNAMTVNVIQSIGMRMQSVQ